MADLTLPIKAAFVLLGVGFLIHMIGYCSPYWHVHEYTSRHQSFARGQLCHFKVNYGIWRFCSSSEPAERMPAHGRARDDDYYRSRSRAYGESCHMYWCANMINTRQAYDYVRAVQFFETVGFLAAVAAILLLLLGVCITSCRDKRILPILSAICAVAAAGCIILGCIIFGAKDAEKPHLSWAFALAIVGGIFHGLAGVLIFVTTLLKK